jgi:AraC-like DNA-binding protein
MGITHFKLCYFEPRVRVSALCSAHAGIRPVGYSYDGESHDFWECVFVFKGRAGITAGETIYSLGEGQMIFHPPGEFHRLWNAGDDFLRIAIVSFAADRFPIDKHTICCFDSEDRVFSTVREIRKRFETSGIFVVGVRGEGNDGAAQKAIGAFEELLIDLLDNCNAENAESMNKDRLSELYSNAVTVMKRNIGVRLTATQISAECGMSVSTMQKVFYRYTGMGMMKYYEGVRMQHAQTLLNNGYLVKEAAFALGYSDQNYFSIAYKRYFGTSPGKV